METLSWMQRKQKRPFHLVNISVSSSALQEELQLQPRNIICITRRIFSPFFSHECNSTMKTVLCLVDLILSRWEINWRCNTTITLLSSFVLQQHTTKREKKAFDLHLFFWSFIRRCDVYIILLYRGVFSRVDCARVFSCIWSLLYSYAFIFLYWCACS